MTEPAPPAAPAPPPPTSATPSPAQPPPAELAPAAEAFERGDFRTATRLLDQLLAARPAPDLEAAARALRSRLAVDPWAVRLALAVTGVLALVVGAYVL